VERVDRSTKPIYLDSPEKYCRRSEYVRSSRLALTCATAAMFRSRPRVKRSQPTRREFPAQLRETFPRERGARLPWSFPRRGARRGHVQT
jgi:hypothetical protein